MSAQFYYQGLCKSWHYKPSIGSGLLNEPAEMGYKNREVIFMFPLLLKCVYVKQHIKNISLCKCNLNNDHNFS